MEVIQNYSFKHQLTRDILTAIGTIVIFVWIIFLYKLYKQIFLINILDAAVWKLWHVWFNFGCFKHICALKLIKYLRDPLKESKTLHSVIYYTVRRLCSKCKMHVALPKHPTNQFHPVGQSRQQALKPYCPNVYTVKIKGLWTLWKSIPRSKSFKTTCQTSSWTFSAASLCSMRVHIQFKIWWHLCAQ